MHQAWLKRRVNIAQSILRKRFLHFDQLEIAFRRNCRGGKTFEDDWDDVLSREDKLADVANKVELIFQHSRYGPDCYLGPGGGGRHRKRLNQQAPDDDVTNLLSYLDGSEEFQRPLFFEAYYFRLRLAIGHKFTIGKPPSPGDWSDSSDYNTSEHAHDGGEGTDSSDEETTEHDHEHVVDSAREEDDDESGGQVPEGDLEHHHEAESVTSVEDKQDEAQQSGPEEKGEKKPDSVS